MQAYRQLIVYVKALDRCHTFNFIARFCPATLSRDKIASVTYGVQRNFWRSRKTVSEQSSAYHNSAMQSKITSGITTGRPFGGTAALIRQQLGTFCYQIVTDNPRIACICVPNQYGPNLIVCSIYMPWSDRSVEHVTEMVNVIIHITMMPTYTTACSIILQSQHPWLMNVKLSVYQMMAITRQITQQSPVGLTWPQRWLNQVVCVPVY